jgi:Zn-dependent protease
MHAQVALWQGDSTAAEQGHLTLNPLKQMGVFSIIMLLVIGFAFGSVPVNPARMKHRYSEALVSFAGPFANLMLFFIFIVLSSFANIHSNAPAFKMFFIGAELNFVLFCFNMVPIPPLDGFGIFSSFFPKMKNSNSEFLNGATIFIFIVLMFSAGILFQIAEKISFKLIIKTSILIS